MDSKTDSDHKLISMCDQKDDDKELLLSFLFTNLSGGGNVTTPLFPLLQILPKSPRVIFNLLFIHLNNIFPVFKSVYDKPFSYKQCK